MKHASVRSEKGLACNVCLLPTGFSIPWSSRETGRERSDWLNASVAQMLLYIEVHCEHCKPRLIRDSYGPTPTTMTVMCSDQPYSRNVFESNVMYGLGSIGVVKGRDVPFSTARGTNHSFQFQS